jgi:hypothetical protein
MAETQTTELPSYVEKPTKTALTGIENWLGSDQNYVYGSKQGESLFTEMNGMQKDAIGNAKWLADQDLAKMFGLDKAEGMWDKYAGADSNTIRDPNFSYKVDNGIGQAGDITDPNFAFNVDQGTGQAGAIDANSIGRAAPTLSTGTVVDESGPLGALASYINPYMQQVLDPQIRELQQESERQRRSIGASAAMSGAFGDARHGVMEGENYEKTNQAIGDVTGRTMADAFLNAMTQRQADASRIDSMNSQNAQLTENAQGRKLNAAQSNQNTENDALARQLQAAIQTGQFKQAGAEMGLTTQQANQNAENDALARKLQADIQTGQFDQAGSEMTLQTRLANQKAEQLATERLGTAATAIEGLGDNYFQKINDVNDSLYNAGNISYAFQEQQRQAIENFQKALASQDYDSAVKLLSAAQGSPKGGTVTTENDSGIWGLLGSLIGGVF